MMTRVVGERWVCFLGVFLILEMFAVNAVQHATVTHMGIHIRDY